MVEKFSVIYMEPVGRNNSGHRMYLPRLVHIECEQEDILETLRKQDIEDIQFVFKGWVEKL